MAVFAVDTRRRMMILRGRAFNVDEALAEIAVQPHQRNGSAHVLAYGHLEKPPHFDRFVIHCHCDLREAANAGTGWFLGH